MKEDLSEHPHANHFTELVVWQEARRLSRTIFQITLEFPKEERYGLPIQIRNSSRSIGAQVAEAWGKRRYEKHFVSKPTDADGEQYETQHWIITAHDSEYLTKEQDRELGIACKTLGSRIGRMISLSAQFCGSTENTSNVVREPALLDEFFAPANPDLI